MENENKNSNLKSDDLKSLNVLRTYTSDMADMIRTNEASVIKIALAEKNKREQEELIKKVEGTTSKKFIWFLTGIIILAVAIFGIYYSIEKKKERETPVKIEPAINSPLIYDSFSKVDIGGYYDSLEILNLIKAELKKTGDWGKIKLISVVKKTTENEYTITTDEFFEAIKSSIPETLTRSFSDNFIIGGYYPKQLLNQDSSEQKRVGTFLVFETKDYNQSYASILVWEKTLLGDLYNLFNIDIKDTNSGLLEKKWQDLIINNRDVRTLNDFQNQKLLYYSFVDKNYLIITDSAEAINELTYLLIYKVKE